jgi:tetratricopeptide (TPR) repeat protein
VQNFIQEKEFEKALIISRKYKKEHTGNNYIMDMLLAKTLLLNKQYKSCDSLLSLMDIIPFEGATDGRGLYWEAKMMQALQAMKNGKYKIAVSFIKQAGEWPENLGVGKPFDADIDSRLEQFFLYKCLLQLKQKDAANEQLDKIIAFKSGVYNTIRNFQPANNLVTKWAIDAKGTPLDWNGWMKEEIEKYPQFKEVFQWVLDAGNGTSLGDSKALVLDPWMRVIQEYRSNFNGL